MDLVLDKKVDQRNDSTVEGTGHVFAILDCHMIGWAQGNAPKGPRNGGQQVGNHEEVVPVVIIRRSNVGPATASEGAKDAPKCDKAGKPVTGLARQEVPESHEGESRTGCYGYKELEEGSFRIAITYSGRDGGKPFLRVAEPFVLDDLVVVERHADDEGAEESSWGAKPTRLATIFPIGHVC